MGALKVRTGPSSWATVVGMPGPQGPPGPAGPAGPGANIPAIDPRDYGATLNGTTDDLAALNTMTDALVPGSVVDFGGRSAYVSAPWTMDVAGVTLLNGKLRGDDYRTLILDATAPRLENFSATRTTGVGTATTAAEMSNVHVTGNCDGFSMQGGTLTNACLACLYLDDGLDDVTIDRVTTINSNSRHDSAGIYAAGGPIGHQRITITRCKVTSTGCAQGIAMYNCADSTIDGCRVSGSRKIIDVTLTGWSFVSGNIYRATDRTDGVTRVLLDNGTQRTENTATPTTPGTNEWGISGGFVYLNLGGTDPATRTITSKITSGYGIYFYGSTQAVRGNKVRACTVTDCDGFGIYFVGGTFAGVDPLDNTIENCTLRDVCLTGIQHTSLPFGGIGISLTNGSITIAKTAIKNPGTPSTGVAPGVRINGTALALLDNVTVRDGSQHSFHLTDTNVAAIDCSAYNSTNDGFIISTLTAITIRVEFKGCRVLTAGGHGVENTRFAGSTLRLTWVGGEVADTTLRGFNMSEVTNLRIDDATVRNWGAAQQGILLSGTAGCVDAVIANCELTHATNTATAVNVSAASTGCTLNGIKPSSNLTTPFVFGTAVDMVVDVRSFGAKADFDLATQTVTTNSTTAFQAAINAVKPGGTVYVPACPPGKAFAHGPLTILNPVTIAGDNRYTSRVVALPTMAAGTYMYNAQVGTLGVDVREESHGFGFQMRDLYLDGARRVPDVGAIKFSQNDRNIIERCQIRNFARQALYFAFSVRESEFRSLYIRWCGGPGFAAIDLTDTAGADQHNNLIFHGCKVLYSFGEALRLVSAQASVRLIEFESCMFHNMTTAMLDSGVGYPDADNYTPTLTGRELETPLIHLVDARGVNFRGCRFHQGGYGQPLVMQRDGAVASPKSSRFTNCSLGDVATRQLTGVSVASNVFTSNNHRFGTGALVRVTGSSLANTTDYWVIRLSANTFSLAATLAAALAGTPVVTVTNASGITIDAQTRQFDLQGTNSYLGVSGCDATNTVSARACIIDWVNVATRVWLTDTFYFATTGIE